MYSLQVKQFVWTYYRAYFAQQDKTFIINNQNSNVVIPKIEESQCGFALISLEIWRKYDDLVFQNIVSNSLFVLLYPINNSIHTTN